MRDYRLFFKGKKVTVMGLGLLGRGVGDAAFLAECGALVTVTDLKSSTELKPSLQKLRKYKSIKYTLGEHRLEDFRGKDMIIKAAGVPLDSLYIKEAEKNNIPVEMDVSLFAKCAPFVTLIGITGTRGKSMTTMLIYEILSSYAKASGEQGRKKWNVYLGGNVRGVTTLPLLKKAKKGDILVCELDSWQLQGFGPTTPKLHGASDSGFSPHIAVFTSFMSDHINYYGSMEKYFADKANIFKYQKKGDVLVINENVKNLLSKNIKSTLKITRGKDVADYDFRVPGEHQRDNLACAVAVAKEFNIGETEIRNAVKKFKGVEGRLQYVKTIKGVKIYNDNNATTPEATIAGIKALKGGSKEIILIFGGADKKLDTGELLNIINKHCKAVVLLPGTGTNKLDIKKLKIENYKANNLKQAVEIAISISKKNNIILFSPAFASFGIFSNEYERNDVFIEIIRKLK